MKKIICLIILIGVMCMCLFGCGVSKKEQQAMLKHLEEKYDEKFVIKKTFTPDFELGGMRGASVYPAGREDEVFLVEITSKNNFTDEYVLRIPEKRMKPLYEDWIRTVIPSAKVFLTLSIGMGSKEVIYNSDETLQEFINKADDISVDVSVMLSEEVLIDKGKDEIFEKLSKLFENEPITGYETSEYVLHFYKQEAFDNIKSSEYVSASYNIHSTSRVFRIVKSDIVDETYCFVHWKRKIQPQEEILKELNQFFELWRKNNAKSNIER